MLDGLSTPENIVNKTAALGLPSVAITDHGNMNNFGYFYQAAKKKNIKPIFGCEFYNIKNLKKWNKAKESLPDDKEKRKEKLSLLRKNNHLVMLVKNQKGFENINRLIYEAQINTYYKPRIDYLLIDKYREGLICSSACIAGEIPQILLGKKKGDVNKSIGFFKDVFGDDFYIEIQFNELKEQAEVNVKLIELAKKHKVKVIITQDSHYIEPTHYPIQQSLLLLQSKNTWKDVEEKKAGVFQFDVKGLSYKSYSQVLVDKNLYNPEITNKQFEKYCWNTFEIDEKVESFEIDQSVKLKDVRPDIKNKSEYLRKRCIKSLKERGKYKRSYVDRLDFELDVIKKQKFEKYFLVVDEIVREAEKKMLVGPGRGSSAGSLVNYCMGINKIDPLKSGLLFERFLNIGRSDLPDIDLDFEDNNQVKVDLSANYPNEVANVSTYSTFQIFGLIKDLGRIHNLEDSDFFNKLNKTIRNELSESYSQIEGGFEGGWTFPGITYEEVYEHSETFKKFVDKNSKLKKDLQILIGKVRNMGKHAGGVIMSDNLIDSMPIALIKGEMQTSLTEGTREKILGDFGYVKMDILGLKTLQIIHNSLKNIKGKSVEDLKKEIHPDNIDFEDKRIYDHVFKEGNLCGVFQFETDKIRPMIKKTDPTCFDDLVAINALFRPGPLQGGFAFEYGDRKKGIIDIDYYDNKVIEKVLKPTYGILVFQEQVMQLGNQLGGLTLVETNRLRKLIISSKKIKEDDRKEVEGLKKKFVLTAVKKHGMKKENVLDLWKAMAKFSGYAFNKSHAVCYAAIAYQCAWIKTYYPKEFYAALLNIEDMDNYSKVISEIKRNGIEVFPIDLNKSKIGFSFDKSGIYWGISKVNGVGEKAAKQIEDSSFLRPFKGLMDFLQRTEIQFRVVNKRVIEILINSGAFDFEKNRRKLILDFFENYNNSKIKNKEERCREAIVISKKKFKEEKLEEKMSNSECFEMELKYYKCSLKYSLFKILGREQKIKTLIKRKRGGGLEDDREYYIVFFSGISRIFDKNRNKMAFLKITDYKGVSHDSIVFSSNYDDDKIRENGVYAVQGELGSGERRKFIINVYKNIDNLFKNSKN
jgi:DNA polymerase-3 subunit alpha